jgi:hypothetical protein
LATKLGKGRGRAGDAGRPLLACALEVSEIFGSCQVRELAAEGNNLFVCLCPSQCGPAIRPNQWLVMGEVLLVVMGYGMRMGLWVVLMMLLVSWLLPFKRGSGYVAGAIGQVTVERRGRRVLLAEGPALLDLLDRRRGEEGTYAEAALA